MGTQNTHIAKTNYVKKMLEKSKENEKGYPRNYIEANMVILFHCTKKTAKEIVQAFIDAKMATEEDTNGEVLLFG